MRPEIYAVQFSVVRAVKPIAMTIGGLALIIGTVAVITPAPTAAQGPPTGNVNVVNRKRARRGQSSQAGVSRDTDCVLQ
jgi:hypothetical protein